MLQILDKVMVAVEPLALAVLLVYTYGFFSRTFKSPATVNAIMGGMFGFAAIVAMSNPIPIADGIFIDLRSLFVGFAAAFFGIIGGTITLAIGLTTRMMIGGNGVFLGLTAMTIASTMGLTWSKFIRPRMKTGPVTFLVLGGMISCHLLVGGFLPPELRIKFFTGIVPLLVPVNMIGAALLSTLFIRERVLIRDAHRLKIEATTDPLTKLSNRSSASAAYAALPNIADRTLGKTMLCIDIDRFKAVNDTHGHLRGDEVLIDVAQRLASCLRPSDIFSRISGDEFVIVLDSITPAQAQRVANRCKDVVSESPIVAGGVEIDVSISVGGAWTNERPSFSAFRKIADDALFQAKERGRNCVAFGLVDFTEDTQYVANA